MQIFMSGHTVEHVSVEKILWSVPKKKKNISSNFMIIEISFFFFRHFFDLLLGKTNRVIHLFPYVASCTLILRFWRYYIESIVVGDEPHQQKFSNGDVWISNRKQILSAGATRVRHTDYDGTFNCFARDRDGWVLPMIFTHTFRQTLMAQWFLKHSRRVDENYWLTK